MRQERVIILLVVLLIVLFMLLMTSVGYAVENDETLIINDSPMFWEKQEYLQ